jgi:3-isopropylmalate dehydrogenase
MLLRHSLDDEASAIRVEAAVSAALVGGARTPDLGGTMTTGEMGDAVLAALV